MLAVDRRWRPHIVHEPDERQGELFCGDAGALSCDMPMIDLTDDELAAVIAALKERIDREWKFRMSPRLVRLGAGEAQSGIGA